MFCKNCGSEIDDRVEICPKCGVRVNPQSASPATNDAPNAGFAVLGFFFPLIGLILYLVWKEEYPMKAKSCGKGALTGFIVYVILAVLTTIFYVIVLSRYIAALETLAEVRNVL